MKSFLALPIRSCMLRGLYCLSSNPSCLRISLTTVTCSPLSYIVKFRVKPSNCSMSRRRIRAQVAWKVATHRFLLIPSSTSLSSRSFISFAALLVNVTARIRKGDIWWCLIRYATRWVITRVLPLPAPDRIRSGPSVCCTASRCTSFKELNRLSDKKHLR